MELQWISLNMVCRRNVDRQNVEQTKCRSDKMSNRQNVDRQNAEKTKCRQFFFFLKFFYAEKQCGRQFWNAVEREPVETRVLNPSASEAS